MMSEKRKGKKGRGEITVRDDGAVAVKAQNSDLFSFYRNPPKPEIKDAIGYAVRRTAEMASETQIKMELQMAWSDLTLGEVDGVLGVVNALAGMDTDWVTGLHRSLKLGLGATLEQVNELIEAETDPKERARLLDLRLKVFGQVQKLLPTQHEVTAKRDPKDVILNTYGQPDD